MADTPKLTEADLKQPPATKPHLKGMDLDDVRMIVARALMDEDLRERLHEKPVKTLELLGYFANEVQVEFLRFVTGNGRFQEAAGDIVENLTTYDGLGGPKNC